MYAILVGKVSVYIDYNDVTQALNKENARREQLGTLVAHLGIVLAILYYTPNSVPKQPLFFN